MKLLAFARQCLRCAELYEYLQACITLCRYWSAEPPVVQDVALQEVSSMRWGQFKSTLADAVVAHLQPIQERYHAVIQDTTYLDQVRLPAVVRTQHIEGGRPPDRCLAWPPVPVSNTYLPVQVLAKGATEAEKSANWTLDNCRQAMGFVPRQPLR